MGSAGFGRSIHFRRLALRLSGTTWVFSGVPLRLGSMLAPGGSSWLRLDQPNNCKTVHLNGGRNGGTFDGNPLTLSLPFQPRN